MMESRTFIATGDAPGQTPHSLHKGNDAYRNGSRPLPTCRNRRCVWSINTASCPEEHFAVFPEELIETPILASCPEHGYVLEPFLGSGTTAIVCERLNRSCLGIELNPAFVKIAKDRIRDAGDKPEHISRKHQTRLDGEIPTNITIDCSQDDWVEE
jgi:DNA modification methylase